MSMQARAETGKCCLMLYFCFLRLCSFMSDSWCLFFLCVTREKTHPDSQRPARTHREHGRPMQPHGQEPGRQKEQERPTGPHAPPQRERDRDHHNPVVWREVASDKRPKSSYTSQDESPQSPRDKRPLSGPNVRTPNLPITEGVKKTAQQSRPFNTYPRSESDSARNPSSQVSTGQKTDRVGY